ncbi:hypothetical protein D3C72_2413290 [compost metagenome]
MVSVAIFPQMILVMVVAEAAVLAAANAPGLLVDFMAAAAVEAVKTTLAPVDLVLKVSSSSSIACHRNCF